MDVSCNTAANPPYKGSLKYGFLQQKYGVVIAKITGDVVGMFILKCS